MSENISQALENIERLLGAENVKVDLETLKKETVNTLGLERQIRGVVYPASTKEVLEIVKIANENHIPLYPISRGKNIGYGDKIPVLDGQLIVDLQRMNNIRSFDKTLGHVVLEPGVTQKQLFDFLRTHEAQFWMDATGAGLESSIIGNSLEGGFGHTPKGNRRNTVSDYEVVLGSGIILQTGAFPGLGPDLGGLFVQSNFGIVTSAKIELLPIPERFESFVISVHENAGLEPLIDTLRSLRQAGTITSLVHVGNATRYLMTVESCPVEYANTLISCEMAQQIMSSPMLKVGYWNCAGGLYGSSREVKAKKNEIRKTLNKIGKVSFFNDSKINLVERLTNSFPLKRTRFGVKINKGIKAYKHVYGLMKGIPSDEPLKNIRWRVDPAKRDDQIGLIWFSPTVPAAGTAVRKVVTIAEQLYKKQKFEMPVTITFVKPDQVIGILSINFNKFNPEEKNRAYQLYDELKRECSEAGIEQYRHGILGMQNITYKHEGKYKTFQQLKKVFDPNNIIAPGRYGI